MTVSATEPEHIAISKSKGIKIDWKDSHHSEYSLAYLRDECPCATCTGAHGTEPQKTNYSSEESKPANPFKMYTPTLKMLKVEDRRRALQDVMSLIMEDLPWIPLYVDQEVYALDRAFQWQLPYSDRYQFLNMHQEK